MTTRRVPRAAERAFIPIHPLSIPEPKNYIYETDEQSKLKP